MKKSIKKSLKVIKMYKMKSDSHREFKTWIRFWDKKEYPKSFKEDINKYWKNYSIKPDQRWYQFYFNATGICDVRFIDKWIYALILEKLNNRMFVTAYQDKNILDFLCAEMKQPKTVIKNVQGNLLDSNGNYITEKQAESILQQYEKCIFKKSFGTAGGDGTKVLNSSNMNGLISQKDYIVQEYLIQNQCLAELSSSAVNTIRITTFYWKGQVYVLNRILRVGNDSDDIVVCNTNLIELFEDGSLGRVMDTEFHFRDDLEICKHTKKIRIPQIREMIEWAKNKHKRFPHFGILGWDFTVDQEGDAVLLEVNNNFPGLLEHSQIFNGPYFGKLTDEVLEYVFSKNLNEIIDSIYIRVS